MLHSCLQQYHISGRHFQVSDVTRRAAEYVMPVPASRPCTRPPPPPPSRPAHYWSPARPPPTKRPDDLWSDPCPTGLIKYDARYVSLWPALVNERMVQLIDKWRLCLPHHVCMIPAAIEREVTVGGGGGGSRRDATRQPGYSLSGGRLLRSDSKWMVVLVVLFLSLFERLRGPSR